MSYIETGSVIQTLPYTLHGRLIQKAFEVIIVFLPVEKKKKLESCKCCGVDKSQK